MPFPSEILVGILVVLATLSLVVQGENRKKIRSLLFVYATLMVVGFYASVITGKTTSSLKGTVAAEKAELPLKFQSTLNVGVARIYENFEPLQDSKGQVKKPMELSNTGMNSMMKTSYKMLEESLKGAPDKLGIKARMVVVGGVAGLRKPAELQKLIDELKTEDKYKELAAALQAAFVDEGSASDNLKEYAATIKKSYPVGWYRDNALLALYKAGDKSEYDRFSNVLEERYFGAFVRFSVGVVIAITAFFVGLVALIIQVGSLSRKGHADYPDLELPTLPIDLKTVFAVFVAWQATEVALGALLRLIPKGALALSKDPVGVSIFVLITYLINMLPAVIFMYYIALKPRGLSFVQAMKIRFRTMSSGPLKLILTGIFSWCSAIPLVVLAFVIFAPLIGNQGSDNPIIGQIISAATTSNFAAIALLFITLAILAPFFEEVIFRGFLYASLRNKVGIFPAMLISSLVFAGIHLDGGGMPMLFAIGFVLAVCYERSRSLVACMVCHGLWNGGSLLLNLSLMAN